MFLQKASVLLVCLLDCFKQSVNLDKNLKVVSPAMGTAQISAQFFQPTCGACE